MIKCTFPNERVINFEFPANNLPKGTSTCFTRMDSSIITKISVSLNTRDNWNHSNYVVIYLQIWDIIPYGMQTLKCPLIIYIGGTSLPSLSLSNKEFPKR